MKLKFVSKEELKLEWWHAVQDAEDYSPDPSLFDEYSQRYVEFFNLDSEEDEVTSNKAMAKYLSTDQQMTAKNFEEIRAMVDDYLSTKNVYWTIVESCEIAGPFEGWHESLSLLTCREQMTRMHSVQKSSSLEIGDLGC